MIENELYTVSKQFVDAIHHEYGGGSNYSEKSEQVEEGLIEVDLSSD